MSMLGLLALTVMLLVVDPRGGGRYAGPQTEYPPDGIPSSPAPTDPGFNDASRRNPDGADIGPLYATPEGDQWLQENVTDHGFIIDWGNREIFDPHTGEIKGTVPKFVPRMI